MSGFVALRSPEVIPWSDEQWGSSVVSRSVRVVANTHVIWPRDPPLLHNRDAGTYGAVSVQFPDLDL